MKKILLLFVLLLSVFTVSCKMDAEPSETKQLCSICDKYAQQLSQNKSFKFPISQQITEYTSGKKFQVSVSNRIILITFVKYPFTNEDVWDTWYMLDKRYENLPNYGYSLPSTSDGTIKISF